MRLLIILIILYCSFFCLLLYTFLCGSAEWHRNGFIGKFYRFLTTTIPSFLNRIGEKCCPKLSQETNQKGCCLSFKRFKYIVVIFFFVIYVFFVSINLININPRADQLFRYPALYKFFSIYVLPWPWILVIMFQFVDPGTITPYNVESYLEIYPFDNVLYKPGKCLTTKLPLVPRSRYDAFTRRRIAYVPL